MSGQTVSIPEAKIEYVTVVIEGVTPLLHHRFSEKAKEDMLAKQMGKPTSRTPKDPEQQYQDSIYYLSDGRYGVPAGGIKASMVSACRFVDNMPMTHAWIAFFVMPEDHDTKPPLVPMLEGEPRMHESIVKLRPSSTDIRFRAEFPLPWSVEFQLRYNPVMITLESVINLIELAGLHVGICDYRPECHGTYGMFRVRREA